MPGVQMPGGGLTLQLAAADDENCLELFGQTVSTPSRYVTSTARGWSLSAIVITRTFPHCDNAGAVRGGKYFTHSLPTFFYFEANLHYRVSSGQSFILFILYIYSQRLYVGFYAFIAAFKLFTEISLHRSVSNLIRKTFPRQRFPLCVVPPCFIYFILICFLKNVILL